MSALIIKLTITLFCIWAVCYLIRAALYLARDFYQMHLEEKRKRDSLEARKRMEGYWSSSSEGQHKPED